MATTVARLEAILSANTRDFDRGMAKSETRMHKAGKAAGVLGFALAGGLAIGLTKSVKEAMEAEKVHARLTTAFKTANLSIKPYEKAIAKADDATRKLGFSDEDAKNSLGSLIVATHNYDKAQKLVNVSMDIARFKGIGLEQATKMLTMAMAGSQRATKQLGLSVQAVTTEQAKAKVAFDAQKDAINAHYDALGKLTPAQEKQKNAQLDAAKAAYDGAKATAQVNDKQVTAEKVVGLVTEKLKGQKEAYAQTTQGGIEIMHAQTQELEEQLGKALLPALIAVTTKLNAMLAVLLQHPRILKLTVIGLVALTGALLTATAAQTALNLAVLANPYVAATVAVLALAAGVALLYAKYKELRPVIEFVLETFIGMPLPLRVLITALGGVQKTVEKLNAVFDHLAAVLGHIKDAISWLLDHAKGITGIFGSIAGAAGKLTGDVDPNKYKNFLGGFGTGPKSVSPALYDELSGARSMGLVLTSGYRPGAVTKHGTKSDHSIYPSKAIDVAGSPSQMARFFRWLIGQTDVKQAFYDPLGSIFGGALSSYREGGHSDHVHVATYDRGGFLQPGWNLAYNGLGRPEPVGAMGPINLVLPDGRVLFSWFQNEERKNNRRNGR